MSVRRNTHGLSAAVSALILTVCLCACGRTETPVPSADPSEAASAPAPAQTEENRAEEANAPPSTPEPTGTNVQEISVEPSFGSVVETPLGAAYWRYTADSFGKTALFGSFSPRFDVSNDLVALSSEGEKVLVSAFGCGELCYAGEKLWYMAGTGGYETEVRSVALDGSGETPYPLADILGLDADGRYLLGRDAQGGIRALDTETGSDRLLCENACFLALRGNTLLYTQAEEDFSALRLYAVETDGAGRRELAAPAFDFIEAFGGNVIAEIRFPTVDGTAYIYFSYGEIAGTGAFYQGGKIARARLDGGGWEIVAGEDGLAAADFLVNTDGSVAAFPIGEGRIGEGLYVPLTAFLTENGTVYEISREDGALVPLFEKPDYAAFSTMDAGDVDGALLLRVAAAERSGEYACLRLDKCEEDEDAALGWRTGYRLLSGAAFRKNLRTGQTELLFRY